MTTSRPSTLTLTAPGRLRLYDTAELLRMPPPRWLVQDVLPAGGLVGLYGPPGAGKSFIAIDFAMSIATGLPWHGKETESGFALYVSAEGGIGIGKRAQAYLSSKGISSMNVNMGWLVESIPISSASEDMDVLLGRITDELEVKPALVIIDTLARCFDGDENMQEDMGRFIAGVDRLRREFDSTVVVVHHTRLDAERERGSTAFRGAADAMLSVARKKGGPLELSCNKQKDAEEFSTMSFELRTVEVVMRGGVVDTSCVIMDERTQAEERDVYLVQLIATGPLSFTELKAATKAHIGLSALKRRLVGLVQNRKIVKKNGVYSVR